MPSASKQCRVTYQQSMTQRWFKVIWDTCCRHSCIPSWCLGGGGRHTHAREEAKFKLKEQLSPVWFRLGKVFSLDLILGIQAALPTKSFIGQDSKCFKAVQGYISTKYDPMVTYRDLRYMLETLLHTKLMFGGWVVDIHMPEERPSSNLKSNSPQSDSDWGRFSL